MLKVVTLLKRIHSDVIFIVDDYKDYYIYGKDTYILYYLLNFTIKKYSGNFYIRNDIDYLNYLIKKLNEYEISYMVLVKRCGYDIEQKMIYENQNYDKFYKKGKLIYKRREEIENIKLKLKKDIFSDSEKIRYIKDLINSDI